MTRFSAVLILLAGALLGCGEKADAPKSTNPQSAGSGPQGTAPSEPQTSPATHQASGSIEAVDPVAGTLRINHGPVASLGWPAMTMDFVVSDKALLNNLKSGDAIAFEFHDRGGDYVVTSIRANQ